MGYLYSRLTSNPTFLKPFLFIIVINLFWSPLYPQSFKDPFESGIRDEYWATEGLKSITSSKYSISGKSAYRSFLSAKQHSNPRCEIRFRGAKGVPNWHPNKSTYGIKFAIYIPKDFKPDKTSSEYLAQFHSVKDKGDTYNNPPWALRLKGNKLSVTNRWIEKKIASNAHQHEKHWNLPNKVVPGKWHYFIVDIHWDYSSNGNGFMKFYMKVGSPPGQSDIKIKYNGPTGYNDKKGSYFKLGIYKWDWKSKLRVNWSKSTGVGDREVYYDDFEIKKNGFGPAKTNKPPVANAGSDKTVELPTDRIDLKGKGTDPDGTIKKYLWTQQSGPSNARLRNDDSPNLSVRNLEEGIYTFRLTVEDNDKAKDNDDVLVKVVPPKNAPPEANAGPDITMYLPKNSTEADGSASDLDGDKDIKSIKWTQKSGPSKATLEDADKETLKISKLEEGQYAFELKVTDKQGEVDTDRVVITVEPPKNQKPKAFAGQDITLYLPTSSTEVDGNASDPDGDKDIKTIKWTQKSGPSKATLEDADKETLKISKLKEGRYAFEIMVTDKQGDVDTDRVVITVEPPKNQKPKAFAGQDITLYLPTSSTEVDGNASDLDGDDDIKSITWTQKSGPSKATLEDADKETLKISKLEEGRYAFELKVTDKNGAVDTDRVVIYVEPPKNQAPLAQAGVDITLQLPTDWTYVEGKVSDEDGNIASTEWTQKSGPTQATLEDANKPKVKISKLQEGRYAFELRVTDKNGEVSTDRVVIVVEPPKNQAPSANAGKDVVAPVAQSTVVLSGSAKDPDGDVASYSWKKSGGGSNIKLSGKNSAKLTLSEYSIGDYKFTLTVTDNDGATHSDEVTVTIVENKPAVVTADVTNSVCDADNGSIALNVQGEGPFTYEWSGGEATKNLEKLAAGKYTVKVKDGNGETTTKSFVVENKQSELKIKADIVNATCTNANGSIKVEVTGGTAPYNYEWSSNARTTSLNKLTSGSYSLVVKDKNGCSQKFSFAVGSDPGQVAHDVTKNIKNASCSDNDGSISLKVNGSNGPYSYVWDHGATGPTLDNLESGEYHVTITDSHGCYMKSTYTINQGPGPVKPTIRQVNDSLFVAQSAASYQWFKDSTAISTATDKALKITEAGVYSVHIVTDMNCESSSDYFQAYEPLIQDVVSSGPMISFYPNPAVDKINIQMSLIEPSKAVISIYDFQGRIMESKELDSYNTYHAESMDVAHYPAGAYLIRAKANQQIVTRRFLKH